MSLIQRRRNRLTRLEEALDAGSLLERQSAVRALLASPLIPSSDPRYAPIRKHAEWIRNWFSHHAEWQLAVTAEAARLRKTPADPEDATRPCRRPKSDTPLTRRGYTYLCLALATLVRADRQTTLGNIAKEIGSHLRAEPRFAAVGMASSLETRDERSELVGAIRLLLEWGVLSRVHDDEERFIRDASADALYNVNRSVMSRILATTNPPSLVRTEIFAERLASTNEIAFQQTNDETQFRQWRVQLFRRLLDDPVLYYDTLTDAERGYLDRQRGSILRAIEEATGLLREVRAEGIAMVDPTGKLTDYRLPEEGTDGHLTLLLAEHLSGLVKATPDRSVCAEDLYAFTRKAIAEHRKHWRKDVTNPGQDRVLTEQILSRLEALALIARDGDRIQPRPALGRYGLKHDVPESESEQPIQAALF